MSKDMTDILKEEISSYELREWSGTLGGVETKLYSKPLSPFDVKIVRKKFPDFMSSPEPSAMVNIICRKALDKNDNKAFVLNKHAPLMERMKASIIAEIFSDLFGDDFEEGTFDEDGSEKNS